MTKKSHFVVKVQLDLYKKDAPRFIYNQDRSLQGYLCSKGNDKVYEELNQQIRRKGFGGLKGYFRVILDKEKQDCIRIKLNPFKIQIVETR